MPQMLKLAKNSHFQKISRNPENFGKLPEMIEFWNSEFKTKFLDKKWVGKILNTLKLVETNQI